MTWRKFFIGLGIVYVFVAYLGYSVTETRKTTMKSTIQVCVEEPRLCKSYYDTVIKK